MRLRTLPLSLAGIVLGIFLAAREGSVDAWTIVFLVLTTVALQVLSNLSNELGDTLSGTDLSDERQGMRYSLIDGGLSIDDMRKLISGTTVACLLFGAAMIWCSFGSLLNLWAVCFEVLGVAAIWAARHYTLGERPYGYRGLGDIFVFIFFGFATVLGAYVLCSHSFGTPLLLLPASAIGCFSVGVLNVNNIRDMKTDAATRTTVALKLGARGARIYQTLLLCLGWVCMLLFSAADGADMAAFAYVITLPLFALHLRGVWKRVDRGLDPMLPALVLSSFAFALLAGLGMIL